jgi:hypothetical protein
MGVLEISMAIFNLFLFLPTVCPKIPFFGDKKILLSGD